MYPTLFAIGGIEFHSHDVLIVLGGLLSLAVFTFGVRPDGITRRDIVLSLPLLLPLTFLCVYLSAVLLRALTVGWISFRVNFAYGTSSFGMDIPLIYVNLRRSLNQPMQEIVPDPVFLEFPEICKKDILWW